MGGQGLSFAKSFIGLHGPRSAKNIKKRTNPGANGKRKKIVIQIDQKVTRGEPKERAHLSGVPFFLHHFPPSRQDHVVPSLLE